MSDRMSEPEDELVAAGMLDELDEQHLLLIRELYEASDPVPAGLVERVQFGLTLDALHAEVAELQRGGDRAGAGVSAGVRSGEATDVQTITFTSSRLTTMVTITPADADRVRVDGWVAPGGGVEISLRGADGVLTTTADPDGRFVFESVAHGLAQLTLRAPGPDVVPVITPSIEL